MMRQFVVIIILLAFAFFAWWMSPGDNNPKLDASLQISGARGALDLLTDVRAYPDKSIPEEGMARAFDFSKRALRKQSHQQDLDAWRAIGPHNIGGRTLTIAINPMNPNTIYAGSASGGVWRSYTAGEGPNAWENIRTGFPVLGVSSIAIAPDDSNLICIGTGEVYGSPETFPGVIDDRTTRGSYGIGILRTTDGGQTWNKSLDWFLNQRRGVQRIKINPLRSGTVWAATTEGTFKSTDAGATWNMVLDVVMATDIEINPVDTNKVFVACGGMGSPNHGVYRTQDGGNSWAKMNLQGESFTFNGKARLSISESSPDIVYASVGKSSGALFDNESTATWLFKTTDGGDSWSTVSTVDYSRIQGWYAHDVAVNPVNPDEVWCAGQPFSPYFSSTGGTNLIRADNLGLFDSTPETIAFGLTNSWADFHDIVYHPTDPEIIYFANDGGVFKTKDGGQTVANCNLGYQTTQFYNGTSSSDSDSLFALGGMQDNGTAAYEGDLNWRRVAGADGSWTAIDQSNNDNIYVSSQFLNISKSFDRGFGQFQTITPPRTDFRTNFIAPFILSPVDNHTMYAGSDVVFKSSNAGLFWSTTNNGQSLDDNSLIALAGSFQNVDVVYAATSPNNSRGRIFRTADAGDNWFDITGDLPDRFPTDLAVAPNSDVTIYVTFGGFGTSHVFKSTNGGSSWQDIGAGLPDVPTWAVIVAPDFPQHVFVGSDLGVYASLDGGENWQEHMQGLPDALFAMDLSISRSNRVLRVATHGNGFYESSLPGSPATNVADATTPLPNTFVLEQNFPNPFNLETKIRYFLRNSEQVELIIFNSRGQEVRSLVNSNQSEGWHEAIWDGKDNSGEIIASGVYLYQLVTSNEVLNRKMIVLK